MISNFFESFGEDGRTTLKIFLILGMVFAGIFVTFVLQCYISKNGRQGWINLGYTVTYSAFSLYGAILAYSAAKSRKIVGAAIVLTLNTTCAASCIVCLMTLEKNPMVIDLSKSFPLNELTIYSIPAITLWALIFTKTWVFSKMEPKDKMERRTRKVTVFSCLLGFTVISFLCYKKDCLSQLTVASIPETIAMIYHAIVIVSIIYGVIQIRTRIPRKHTEETLVLLRELNKKI